MSSISINGVTISSGRHITVINGKVVVDGKDVTPECKEINIVVNGNIEKIDADSCDKIHVSGDVGTVSCLSGSVEVSGNITGSVNTMSGNIDCSGKIGGSVSTMTGNIKHRA